MYLRSSLVDSGLAPLARPGMTACGGYFLTQITRTADAFAPSMPGRPVAGAT